MKEANGIGASYLEEEKLLLRHPLLFPSPPGTGRGQRRPRACFRSVPGVLPLQHVGAQRARRALHEAPVRPEQRRRAQNGAGPRPDANNNGAENYAEQEALHRTVYHFTYKIGYRIE